jgi:hypothetical protein
MTVKPALTYPISGLFGAVRYPSPQVKGHLPVTGDGSSPVRRTLSNVAGWTGEAGDAAAARDLLAELLASYERVLGPDHPDTLTARD